MNDAVAMPAVAWALAGWPAVATGRTFTAVAAAIVLMPTLKPRT